MEHDQIITEQDPGQNISEEFIVGIGASAGGVKALQTFFEHVPAKSGMTFVVILHLSPDHDSKLAEVLMHSTSMHVMQVKERTKALKDTVYVIPPDAHLTMDDGHIEVSPRMSVEDRRAPVDIFFRTLAESHGDEAACVILSGTGANGSMGLKRIKEKGGVTFVQNPVEAEYSDMPRNAIATELVDEILPVALIPGKIIEYRNGRQKVKIPGSVRENKAEIQVQALTEIFKQLRMRTGHDFSNYKRPTLIRRLERRMNIRQIFDLTEYAAFLQTHTEESTALLKDLLISVTNFFRDKNAFNFLERKLLKTILKDKKSDDVIRIWVAGCATGEEAYSIAMLCAEYLNGIVDAPKVQLFATDIDEAAIAQAREGLYSLNDAADISPERMTHFFIKEGERYRVRREIREMILFANHNFLKDPPFSHLDMISCRNVMIYLNNIAQGRVLGTFHFALNPGGFLFLGSSESIDSGNDLYTIYNRENHVFQSRKLGGRSLPLPENIPSVRMEPVILHHPTLRSEKRVPDRITYGDLHRRLLEQYSPPSVVVNEEYEIVHLSESAGKYFQLSGGEISQNLLKLVRQEIRMELRTALYRARQESASINLKALKIITDTAEIVNIHVRPVFADDDAARGFFLIIFEPDTSGATTDSYSIIRDEPIARHLEDELILVKQQLRNSVEHHEFQAEELKASNEELQAMNEELRSAAEELETSKEELQSINEELRTVNQELKIKIEETTLSGNNLQNLINSVDIGTIFLDRGFRVNLFTPAATDIFNLLPADFGRPLTDITSRLVYDGLREDAEMVVQQLLTIEREVETTDDRYFIMRISPYRTSDDRINGVVVSFIEITGRKKSERALQDSESRFRTLTDAVPQVIWANDNEGVANYFNKGWYEYTGLSYDRSYRLGWQAIVHPDDEPASVGRWHEALQQGVVFDTEYRLRGRDGTYRWFIGRNVPVHDGEGKVTGWFGSATDVEELKNTEEDLRESEARLRATMESATAYAIITTDKAGIIEEWNPGAENIFGYTKEEVTGMSAELIFTPEDRAAGALQQELAAATQNGRAADERWHLRKNGERFYMSGVVSPIYEDALTGFVKVARDLTEEKYAEESLRVTEERYRVALASAGMGAWDWNVLTDTISWNEQHFIMMGAVPADRTVTPAYFLQFIHENDRETMMASLEEAKQTGEFNVTFRIKRADNHTVRWMKGYGRVVETTGGQASRMVGVMYDITEQKLLEQQKEDFIGIAGHELKTPVTSIKAYADLLQDMLKDSPDMKAADISIKLNNQVERLSELIKTVLDTTKISEGLLPLKHKTFDLNELIAERCEVLRHLSEEHTIIFKPTGSADVEGDRERIDQVLTNLIMNAINYSPRGSSIYINTRKEKQYLEVSVRDEGIGIAKDQQLRVFEKFFRVEENIDLHSRGMGLGLYISAGIINQHGGTISVESIEGKGTVFNVRLPYKKNNRAI